MPLTDDINMLSDVRACRNVGEAISVQFPVINLFQIFARYGLDNDTVTEKEVNQCSTISTVWDDSIQVPIIGQISVRRR